MSIQCPNCKKEYDITLFQFDKKVKCDCGTFVSLSKEMYVTTEREIEHSNYRKLQLSVDKVCSLILNESVPENIIERAKLDALNICKKYFPDKIDLFEMIYSNRFKRLYSQFRKHFT